VTANSTTPEGKNPSALVQRFLPAVIPAKIINGHCPWCDGDLSFLFPAIQAGDIPPPNSCSLCGKPVRDDIEVEILRCSNCKTEIIRPDLEKFCRGCSRHLDYSGVNLNTT